MSDIQNPFERPTAGPPIASFDEIGDSVEGTIVKIEYRQDLDPATNEPRRFPSGEVKPVVVVTLKQEDGELIRDFVKGRSVSLFRSKVWAAQGEQTSPTPGAKYKRKLVRVEEPTRRGFSGEKIFEIDYSAPDMRELI
jgi:hypothetical protein